MADRLGSSGKLLGGGRFGFGFGFEGWRDFGYVKRREEEPR